MGGEADEGGIKWGRTTEEVGKVAGTSDKDAFVREAQEEDAYEGQGNDSLLPRAPQTLQLLQARESIPQHTNIVINNSDQESEQSRQTRQSPKPNPCPRLVHAFRLLSTAVRIVQADGNNM